MSARNPLDQQIALLASAERDFMGGLHSADQSAPLALLDPFFASVLAKLPAGAAAGPGSSLLTGWPVNENGSFRFTGEHVRRALRSLESGLFVASRRADLQRRQQKDGDAAASVRRAEVRTWIDLAALAPALGKSPSTWADDVTPLRNALRDASRRFTEIAQGRNLFGYADGYVPFLWHYNGPTSGTNFTQIKALADSNQSIWNSLYSDASSSLRAFESSTRSLASELSNQQSTISLQLQDICGASVADMSQCGANGSGQLTNQMLEVQAAALRIENIQTQMANVYESINIEEDRAARVAGLQQNQAVLVLQTGERVYAADKAIRITDAAEKAAHSLFGGILGSMVESVSNPAKAAAAFFQGAGDAVITGVAAATREGYEHDKAEAIAYQNAQVEYNAAQTELIDSAARVKTNLLQIATLKIDHDIALVNLAQAHGQLRTLWSRASSLASDQTRVAAIAKVNGQYAMHYRVYANYRTRGEAAAMDRALAWSFLATRAIGYQLVQDMPIANLLQVRDPLDLLSYLGGLSSTVGGSPSSQSNSDVISLRDRILGLGEAVKDTTTGTDVSPRERFRHFVADPAHRDAQGNFHILFTTAGLDRQVFSPSVCSDRIQTVAVNLVGDSLGARVTSAYVKLKHGGTSYLRSCAPATDGTTTLVAYDMTTSGNGPATARVHAAINGMTDGVAQIPADYELSDRAVLADTWELIIEAGDNAGLNVLGLDDIQLTFVHDAYTIQ
jgi:hypothetical protein